MAELRAYALSETEMTSHSMPLHSHDSETKINYSIIIPHKNSHTLLERCLNSIPPREDVEIIVVDDNSDDIETVKTIIKKHQNATFHINQGYGAGGARNTGLNQARGKWLLFADCDDYYVDGFLEELDKYVGSDYEVIYFNFFQFKEGNDVPESEKVSNYIKECAEGTRSVDYVKYRNNTPWNKMIARKFVEGYQIRFEEQPIGNDMFFSFQVGYLCKKYTVVDSKLYNYIVYKKSLTKSNWDEYKIKTYLENKQKFNGFVEFVGHKEWRHGFLFLCLQLYKAKDLQRAKGVLSYYFRHFFSLYKVRQKYTEDLRAKALNA